ncbi:hypothetical protein IT575_13590 [bacterium]|nr:hypothetical protein [bacterium]
MSAHSGTRRLQEVFSNPVLALLLWTCAVTDRVDQQLCRLLGLRDVDLETLEAVYGDMLKMLRALRVCAPDCGVEELGQVLKTHLGAGLLQGMLHQRPEQMEYSARLLTRLPLWIRDPELASLEREARVSAARARIEEVNLRREESAARRLNLPATAATVPAAPAAVPAAPAPVPLAPAPAPESHLPASAEVKSRRPEGLKVLIPGADEPVEVKSDSPEPLLPPVPPAADPGAGRPQASAQQGRRKLPKAARKAAVAAGRR